MTVNQASRLDSYPLPRVDELFATLEGGKTFSKLDLQHAYLQLPLEMNSKQYTTINTHRGLFQYNRLPFGVLSAPGIFQKAIDDLVKGIPHVTAYMDDILLTGGTQEQHLQNLTAVLERLKVAGVRLKKPNCLCMAKEVECLGHKVNELGINSTADKIKAIRKPCSHTT